MPKNDVTRKTLRLPRSTAAALEEFARRNSLSTTAAADHLIRQGLDAELAGVENLVAVEQKLMASIGSLRGLVVAALDSADTACALQLQSMVKGGQASSGEVSGLYQSARTAAGRLKALKKGAANA